jgi:hypothetical protein
VKADDIAGLLEDRPWSGRPRRISEQREAAIAETTMKTRPKDGTQWSVRAMAAAQKSQFGNGAANLEETQAATASLRTIALAGGFI